MKGFDKREKTYIVLLIFLIIILFVKSILIDGYTPKNEEELLFKTYVESVLEKRFDNYLYSNNVLTYKIVDIGKVSEIETSIVEHYDPVKKEDLVYELRGNFKAKVRSYLFGLLPIGQDTVRITNDK